MKTSNSGQDVSEDYNYTDKIRIVENFSRDIENTKSPKNKKYINTTQTFQFLILEKTAAAEIDWIEIL